MKNSKQKTLRYASAVFTDEHCLYRIAVVRYVDSLFYESGDARRSHSRCYSLIVRELFGIGKNTFRHYLHYPSDRLAGIVIPRKLRELLRLYVLLIKQLSELQSACLLCILHRQIEAAFEDVRRQGLQPDVARLLERLGPKTDSAR